MMPPGALRFQTLPKSCPHPTYARRIQTVPSTAAGLWLTTMFWRKATQKSPEQGIFRKRLAKSSLRLEFG